MPAIGGAPGIRGPMGRLPFSSTALSTVTPWMAGEWDVFSLAPGGSATAPTYLATLYEAREKSIRVELDGTGTGSFAINRSSPECTEAILAQGNLVKVRIPEIHTGYLFAFFLETGDFTLISSDEAGGEMLTFGGRGILSYTEYACAWSASYVAGGQGPIDNVWRAYAAGTGNRPGQILRRMLEEMQNTGRPQLPLPLLTIDFDYAVDSNAVAWSPTDATAEFSYQAGDNGLAILTRLLETRRMTVQMGPDFDLHAYNSFGRELIATVRFERGVNIATELRRTQAPSESKTHMLVAGETDRYGRAVDTGAADRVTKEGYVAAFGTGTTALAGIGAAELQRLRRTHETIMFPIANRRTAVSLADPVTVGAVIGPNATAGHYLPGPEGTSGDFWVGDTVRVHTGTGPFDFNEVDFRVMAITISRDDDNHELIVIPELEEQPPSVVPFAVLYRSQLDAPDSIYPGTSAPIVWVENGDTGHSIQYPYAPTVGPITFIPVVRLNGQSAWSGMRFGGVGDITFESTFTAHTACNQPVRVNILLNGAVVATGTVVTFNPQATIEINATISVADGDELTAEFLHEGTACQIYVDYDRLTIIGTTLQVP